MLISKSTFIHRKLPCNLDENSNDFKIFENALQQEIKESNLKILENYNIFVCNRFLYNKIWHIDKDSITDDCLLFFGLDKFSILTIKFYLKFFIKSLFQKKIFYEASYLWIIDQNSYNYFHWFCDAIPRLVAAKKIINNPKILLPESYEKLSYVRESLNIFSVSNLSFIPENCIGQVKKIFFPTYIANTGNYNDDIMKEIRYEIREYFADKRIHSLGEKIYLSRAKADKRKIINEIDLIKLLNQYGFKAFVFEELSFEEQGSIAFHAKYLISNHGAGLTNMLFMEAGSKVLEFRPEGDAHNNCYFALASALDIKYYYQICQPASGFSTKKPIFKDCNTLADLQTWEQITHQNIIVDLNKFESNLSFMLEIND